jgi:molybdenum cofactor biosynthesis enzyme MoaA
MWFELCWGSVGTTRLARETETYWSLNRQRHSALRAVNTTQCPPSPPAGGGTGASRHTADGMWFLCLYGAHGIDLRRPLREGASQDETGSLIARGWTNRADRGAEDRKALDLRGPLYQIQALRKDSHREMHTRGG